MKTVFDYANFKGYTQTNPFAMMHKSSIRYVVPKSNISLSLKENEAGKFALALLEHKPALLKKIDAVARNCTTTMLFLVEETERY